MKSIRLRRVLRLVLLPLLGVLGAPLIPGCANAPQKFAEPEQAAESLVGAARAHSTEQLKQILGSGSDDIISSGDEVADQLALDKFVEAYEQKHQLVADGDGRMSLLIGSDEWPLPIPLVRSDRNDTWYFDAEAARDEIVNRRIGHNELDAIQVCLAIVDAQREYARRDPQGVGLPVYATKVSSSPGARDGLYWPAGEGEPASPLGELVASATEEGYTRRSPGSTELRPYHGYLYRLLTSQGDSARGGKLDYLVNGKLLGGFGVVAFPADYENSGIMTFIVNHDGIVYETDLGSNTDAIARKMSAFDPGPGWRKAPTSGDGETDTR